MVRSKRVYRPARPGGVAAQLNFLPVEGRLGRRAGEDDLGGDQSFSHLAFDDVPDKTPSPLEERQLVSKYAFQKNTNAVVSGHVGCRDQHYVLGKPKMSQVGGFS